jgi:hypothetical protein
MSRYYAGSGVLLTFTCRDTAGTLTTPTTFAVHHQNPAGTKEELSPALQSTGVYTVTYVFVDADAASGPGGLNEFEAVATGAVVDADKIQFRVHTL